MFHCIVRVHEVCCGGNSLCTATRVQKIVFRKCFASSSTCPCKGTCRLPEDAACQPEYAHCIEVHDVGEYRFKGVAQNFNVKSINTAALAGRNAGYRGQLKASKASKMSDGKGFELVRTSAVSQSHAVSSPAVDTCKLVCVAPEVEC